MGLFSDDNEQSFNPYYRGLWSVTAMGLFSDDNEQSFNPYYRGLWSVTTQLATTAFVKAVSFNPYYRGLWSVTNLPGSQKRRRKRVSILIIVDCGR